jgi:hypothetical protein
MNALWNRARTIVALWLIGFVVVREASGAIVLSEDFTYPTGVIAGRDGGIGWSAGFIGNGAVISGNLEYRDALGVSYPSSGNHVATITNGNGMFRGIDLAAQPGLADASGKWGADGTTIYLGFLMHLEFGFIGAFGDYGGVSFFDGNIEHLFFGDLGFDGFHVFWGIDPQQGSAAVRESTVPVDFTVRLLVARIDFKAGAESVRLYVDPVLDQEPAVATVGPFEMHDFRFTRLRIQGGGNGRYGFDELRLGTSYADVVPEPSSASFTIFGALAAFWRRAKGRGAGAVRSAVSCSRVA